MKRWANLPITPLILGFLAASRCPPAGAQTATSTAVPAAGGREAQLEDEVRQLKEMVKQLSARVDQLTITAKATADGGTTGSGATARDMAGTGNRGGAGGGDLPRGGGPGTLPDVASSTGGSAAPRGPLEPRRSSRFDMPGLPRDLPTDTNFGPGFQIRSKDSEYQIQFHDLLQADARIYEQGGQQPVHSTFVIPREWFILSGRLTRPFEYYVAFAQGIDAVNLLDGYLNINFDSRMQFKIGRYKTPFTYEFYNLSINSFPVPERSLFYNNFGLNRDLGMMAFGQLFQNRFDYAAGIFNGSRNGFVDANDFKDFAGLVNFRPFATREGSPLENLSFGGSVDYGKQNNTPIPTVFRTNVAVTGNLAIGPEFMALNNLVRETGDRGFWAMHLAYYYRHLSLISEWESGFQSYAKTTNLTYRTRLPVQSFYVMGGYFLTGEVVSGRGMVRPRRDFDVRKGKFGLGAVELAGRYSFLNIGRDIFGAGLSDPNLWTNQLYTIDLGMNWYWTQYIKVYIGWQHAGFGDPVLYAPNRWQLTSDQFWLRFQIFF